MYTVKKCKKGEILRQVETSIGTLTARAPKNCFAVIAPDGQVAVINGQSEIYTLRVSAEMTADWYNNRPVK